MPPGGSLPSGPFILRGIPIQQGLKPVAIRWAISVSVILRGIPIQQGLKHEGPGTYTQSPE